MEKINKNCPSRKVVTNRKAVNPVSQPRVAPQGERHQGLGSVAGMWPWTEQKLRTAAERRAWVLLPLNVPF